MTMNNDSKIDNHDNIVEKLSGLSVEEFLDLGSDGLSYIKGNGIINGHKNYTLYSADGSHLASGEDLNVLRGIASQNQLIPMSIQ